MGEKVSVYNNNNNADDKIINRKIALKLFAFKL